MGGRRLEMGRFLCLDIKNNKKMKANPAQRDSPSFFCYFPGELRVMSYERIILTSALPKNPYTFQASIVSALQVLVWLRKIQ